MHPAPSFSEHVDALVRFHFAEENEERRGVGYAQLAPGITFSSTATFNSDQNNEGFSSDAYTQLARATATETDPQKLKQVYTQMNDLLLDEAFASAIASAPPRVLLKSNVQGLGYTMHEGFDWTNVWLS